MANTGFIIPKNISEKIVRIAMPIQHYNDPGWRPIINKLAQQNIKVQIKTNTWNENYNDFVEKLLSWGNTGIDIALVDNEELDVLSNNVGNFWFSQDISSLFHYAFHDYFSNKQYTFVPFAIDPLVTFSKTPIADNPQSIDRDTIVNNSMTSIEPNKLPFQMGILFGISSLDISLLKNKQSVYSDYVDILAWILYQSLNRPELLDTIKTYSSNMLEEKIRDLAKYKRLVGKMQEKDPKCKYYPKLCFLRYKATNFAFGYLSDLEIVNQYLWWSDYVVYNFPISSNVYPVKLRGWVVNKANYNSLVKVDSDGVSLAGVFFQEYIAQATNGNSYLWPTLFSAFNVILTNQETDLNRRYISQYKSKRQRNELELRTDAQYEQLVALLQEQYDLKVFLSRLSQ